MLIMNEEKGVARLIVLTFNELSFCIYWKTVSKTPCLYFKTHTTLTVFKKSVISVKKKKIF